jgi:hypothetical protein
MAVMLLLEEQGLLLVLEERGAELIECRFDLIENLRS